jgi:hypothetical protein
VHDSIYSEDWAQMNSSRSTVGVRGPLLSRAGISSVVDLVWKEFLSTGVGVLLRLPLNVPERDLTGGEGTSPITFVVLMSPPNCSSSRLGIGGGTEVGIVIERLLGVRDPDLLGVAIAVSSSGTFLLISMGVPERSSLVSEKSREVQLGR